MLTQTKSASESMATAESDQEGEIDGLSLALDGENKPQRTFVIHFDGDVAASGVEHLRIEVSAVLTMATTSDEVVVCIESPGGMVHSYGLAASQ